MQMMATYSGATLKPVYGHVRKRHNLRGSIEHEVNSYHSYGLAECPKTFQVAAISEDDEIEAIMSMEFKWEGWMWHPERETPFSDSDINRLRLLFT